MLLISGVDIGDNLLCYNAETQTLYRYLTLGGSYSVDGGYVLDTADGGDTRWIGIAGQYIYNLNVTNGFEEQLAVVQDGALVPVVTAKYMLKRVIIHNEGAPLGSINNPYIVWDELPVSPEPRDILLDDVRDDLDAYYLQAEDIDLSSYSNWVPIGQFPNVFTGHYDGNGYEITGLNVDGTYYGYGLFGGIGVGASLKNIYLVSPVIVGRGAGCGALCGRGSGSNIIDNCHATDVNIVNEVNYNAATGGLLGIFGGATVTDCYATGTVYGREAVGGLCGEMNSGSKLTRCWADCKVGERTWGINNSQGFASGDIGGLIGYASGFLALTDCYVADAASVFAPRGSFSPNGAGGIVGQTTGGGNKMTRCYMSGVIKPCQYLFFSANPTGGTFELIYNGSNIGTISANGGDTDAVQLEIQAALTSAGLTDVIARRNGATSWLNSYQGGFSFVNLPLNAITVDSSNLTPGTITNTVVTLGRGTVGTVNSTTYTKTYWDETVNSDPVYATGEGATAKTTSWLQTYSNFTADGWDTTNVWDITGSGYMPLYLVSYAPMTIPTILTTHDIKLGTTAGGNDILPLTSVDVGSELVTADIRKVFSMSANQSIYLSCDDWWGGQFNVSVGTKEACDTI